MKKSELKLMIREVVREEIRFALKEFITNKKPSNIKPNPKPKVVENKSFTKNSVLNEVLNETAMDGDWKTMGGKEFTTDRMGEIMGQSYGEMMNDTTKPSADNVVASLGGDPDNISDDVKSALTRDYSGLMKAIDKKKLQKTGN